MTPRSDVKNLALAALDSPTHREAKRPTQDGFLWPFQRHEMRSPRRIRERIAEDAENLLDAGHTRITAEDFVRLGWRREQLSEHGLAALGLLRHENACGNDAMEAP